MTTPVTPLRQPPGEDLRNARAIAQAWAQVGYSELDNSDAALAAFQRIDELLGAALDKLGEPSPAAVEAARPWVRRDLLATSADEAQAARDVAAAVTRAAVEGSRP